MKRPKIIKIQLWRKRDYLRILRIQKMKARMLFLKLNKQN